MNEGPRLLGGGFAQTCAPEFDAAKRASIGTHVAAGYNRIRRKDTGPSVTDSRKARLFAKLTKARAALRRSSLRGAASSWGRIFVAYSSRRESGYSM